NSYSVTRMRMEDLQSVVSRITDLEYNQAVTALDTEAMAGESASELKGIFSDGFYDMSRTDLYHPDFGVTFSLESGEILLPTIQTKAESPLILQGTSKVHKW